MSQKLRVSKAGYNVLTETDLNNIIYDSEYDTLKYYAEGLISMPISKTAADPAYETTSAITHSLGYYPFFEIVVEHLADGIFRMIGTAYVTAGYGSGSGVFRKFEAYVTTTTLVAKIRGDTDGVADSYTANFRYKIYRNDLGL